MIDVAVELVKLEQNKSDIMTRVPKKSLSAVRSVNAIGCADVPLNDIKMIHDICHFGTERTTELIKERYPEREVNIKLIKDVVGNCETCLKICPTPKRFFHGKLSTPTVWNRIYSDITHFQGRIYLTLVDSCSRFCIWREV